MLKRGTDWPLVPAEAPQAHATACNPLHPRTPREGSRFRPSRRRPWSMALDLIPIKARVQWSRR